MRKVLDKIKYKFGWQTYKACIWDIDPIDRRFTLHMINLRFIWFIGICTFIKCKGGKFNNWLNTKFEK